MWTWVLIPPLTTQPLSAQGVSIANLLPMEVVLVIAAVEEHTGKKYSAEDIASGKLGRDLIPADFKVLSKVLT